jgi:hypothetical protein
VVVGVPCLRTVRPAPVLLEQVLTSSRMTRLDERSILSYLYRVQGMSHIELERGHLASHAPGWPGNAIEFVPEAGCLSQRVLRVDWRGNSSLLPQPIREPRRQMMDAHTVPGACAP